MTAAAVTPLLAVSRGTAVVSAGTVGTTGTAGTAIGVALGAGTGTGTAATVTPSPRPADPNAVTPGLWGFAVVFVLAIAVWLLMRNMTGHLRRMRFREQQDRLRREQENGLGDDREPPRDAGRG